MAKGEGNSQRLAAGALIIVTTIFWLWFGIGSAAVEGSGLLNWIIHILLPGLLFMLSGLIAWRWGGMGGALLVIEGLVALGFIVYAWLEARFVTSGLILMCLTLALPPLAAGILFLVCWQQAR
jgi:hypothetical protein